RMQLERLAREIIVEAALLQPAGNGIGAGRGGIAELVEHGRVAFDRLQHVDEAPKHMRPDRLALKAAGGRRDLGGGDAEMIGPEPDKALDKTDLSIERRLQPRPRLGQEDLLGRARIGLWW